MGEVKFDVLNLKNVNIPIGYCKIEGPVEDFYITIFDRKNNKFKYRVKDGNILSCDFSGNNKDLSYEVR